MIRPRLFLTIRRPAGPAAPAAGRRPRADDAGRVAHGFVNQGPQGHRAGGGGAEVKYGIVVPPRLKQRESRTSRRTRWILFLHGEAAEDTNHPPPRLAEEWARVRRSALGPGPQKRQDKKVGPGQITDSSRTGAESPRGWGASPTQRPRWRPRADTLPPPPQLILPTTGGFD